MSDDDREPLTEWVPHEQDQRSEYRLSGRVGVDLQVEADDPLDGAPPRWLPCSTRDVSASGLSVVVDECLPQGALLPIQLVIDGEAPHRLMTEVVWVETLEEKKQYRVGLRLLEGDDTTLAEWKETVARLMEAGH